MATSLHLNPPVDTIENSIGESEISRTIIARRRSHPLAGKFKPVLPMLEFDAPVVISICSDFVDELAMLVIEHTSLHSVAALIPAPPYSADVLSLER